MLFTSFEFVAFLACVLVLYYLVPVRFQWILLLVANVFFYACSGLYGLLFMGVTIVTSYAAARIMSAVQYHMDDTVKAHKEVWSKQERKAYKQQMKRKKRDFYRLPSGKYRNSCSFKICEFCDCQCKRHCSAVYRKISACPRKSCTAAWHFLLYVSDNGICD